jgi:minor extracellular serine protease Vpr
MTVIIDDAVDIINMSLGSPFGHPDDPSAIAAQNAVKNGVVVVASAGNEGTAPYVTGSPAVADGVISVAASIDDGATAPAMSVNSGPGDIAGVYEARTGDFGPLFRTQV